MPLPRNLAKRQAEEQGRLQVAYPTNHNRSLQVYECVQAQNLQRTLKRHHVQLRYKDSDPFMPSSGGTRLHPYLPRAAEPAPPPEQAAAPGLDDNGFLAQVLEEISMGGGHLGNGASEADFDDDWQQALWADAYTAGHAAQAPQ